MSISILGLISVATSGPTTRRDPNEQLPLPSHLVHQFEKPVWVENIRVRQNGQLLVTFVAPSPDVYLIDPTASQLAPTSNATANLVHDFTPYAGLLGITEVQQDQFYVAAGNFSLTTGDLGAGTWSVWSVDLRKYDAVLNSGAVVKEVTAIPEAGFLNGMDTLDVSRNLIVVADSEVGQVWLLDVATGKYSVLVKDSEMAVPAGSYELGINGLKVLQKGDTAYLYFSNQATARFSRVPVSLSQLQSTGPAEILLNGTVVDDFVLDEEKGVAFLSGALENTLLSIPLAGGAVTKVLGGLNESVIEGPTSASLGRGTVAKDVVYVTTNGGVLSPVNGTFTEGGKVVAVDISDYPC